MGQLNGFTLYLTEECNFNCSYCYYRKTKNDTLSLNQIKKGFTVFFDQLVDKKRIIHITIMGGEPFLFKEKLIQTVDFIRKEAEKRELNIMMDVFTNGSLLDSKTIDLLIDKEVEIYVSLDGIKEANDKQRKLKANPSKSTFNMISSNLDKLRKDQLAKIGINMVFTPDTCQHIMESIRYFRKYDLLSLDVSLSTYDSWKGKDMEILRKQMASLVEYYLSTFKKGSKEKPFQMYRIRESIGKRGRRGWRCGMVKLGPDGKFYFCDSFFSVPKERRQEFNIGDIKEGINVGKRKKIKMDMARELEKNGKELVEFYNFNKRAICPYLLCSYALIHKKDVREMIANLKGVTALFSDTFLTISDSLRNNAEFRKMYDIKEEVSCSMDLPREFR